MDISNRHLGMLMGLVVGDCLGSPIQFTDKDAHPYIEAMEPCPVFNLPPGYWTDDSSMAFCVMDSFVRKNGYDLQDIAEAWGEVSEEHNWNIGPEWTLAILYVMVYGPLVKQALYDRRMAEMEARVKEQEERIRIVEQKQNAANGDPTTIHIDPNYKPSAEGPAQN